MESLQVKFSISIILVFAIASLLSGCITIATNDDEYAPKLSEATMASKVDETTYEVAEKVDAFTPNSPEFHIVAQLSGGEAYKTTVKAEWLYIDKEILIDTAECTAGYREGPVWFSLSQPDNGWPIGKYQVTLYADDIEMIVKFFEVK
jgi:hypothetical protein